LILLDVFDLYAMKNYADLVNIAKEWLISSWLDTKTIYSGSKQLSGGAGTGVSPGTAQQTGADYRRARHG
jgi:hypothetical protein